MFRPRNIGLVIFQSRVAIGKLLDAENHNIFHKVCKVYSLNLLSISRPLIFHYIDVLCFTYIPLFPVPELKIKYATTAWRKDGMLFL